MEKTVNIKNLRNTKAYDETMLYSSSIGLLKEAYKVIENVDKYGRECFGIQFVKKIVNIVHIYKNAYKTDDVSKKIVLLENIFKTLDAIGTDLKVLRELQIISDKHYGKLILKYGPIMSQTVNFINSLKKK